MNELQKMTACPGPSIHSKLDDFRHEGKYSDVSILLAGKTFKCHRNILAAASSYFDSMFCGNFKESYPHEFQLHDIDLESFEKILQNIYVGESIITTDNVFDLLRTSEFLSVQTIRDSCIEFVLNNKYSIKNVIEMFIWARTFNISQLIDPLLECISNDFIRLSENTAFLQMPFEDLRSVLMLTSKKSSLFRLNDLIVDALVRWLHYSYTERKDYFQMLGAIVPSADISIEYSEFLSKKYQLDLANPDESFFHTYIERSNQCSSDQRSLSTSFADHQLLTNCPSIHVYLKNKIFSINKYKPDGYISYAQENRIIPERRKSLITSSESDFVYCMDNNAFHSQSLYAYSSIDLSESNMRRLCPPPVLLGSKGTIDENGKKIYFGWAGCFFQEENQMYSASHKAFTEEELAGGVFYYNCEIDEWFTIPQVRMEERIRAQAIIDHNLVYFISRSGNVQAYDTRSSPCVKPPNTNFRYYDDLCCCALDGKIYVGGGQNTEMFDSVANKWEILQSCERDVDLDPPSEVTYMVPYENMIWLFHEDYLAPGDELDFYYYTLTLDVYHPNSEKWLLPHKALSGGIILAKSGWKEHDYDFLNEVIVFKSN